MYFSRDFQGDRAPQVQCSVLRQKVEFRGADAAGGSDMMDGGQDFCAGSYQPLI